MSLVSGHEATTSGQTADETTRTSRLALQCDGLPKELVSHLSSEAKSAPQLAWTLNGVDLNSYRCDTASSGTSGNVFARISAPPDESGNMEGLETKVLHGSSGVHLDSVEIGSSEAVVLATRAVPGVLESLR